MRITRLALYSAIIIVTAIILVSGTLLYQRTREQQAAQTAAIGGPFELTDQDGKLRKSSDFIGHPLIIYFGYTYCPDVCPTSLQAIAEALNILGDKGKDLVPIFITVDPGRDTPKVLKEYLPAFGPRFVGLTGSAAELKPVLKEFRVFAKIGERDKDDPNGYLVSHTSFSYLIDRKGNFVSVLPHGQTPEKIAEALRKLL